MWTARVVWVALPFTAGAACSDALGQWSTPAAMVAAALLWAAWASGLVALMSPRPWGFTVLRIASAAAVSVTLLASPGRGAATISIGLVGAVAAAAAACSSRVAHAAAAAASYGHEQRFPLRAPTPITIFVLPPALVVVVAGIATGPLLVATGVVIGGIGIAAAGLGVAAVLVRSIHGLARRWVVLVPAGMVVADPLTLSDPALLPREQVASVRRLAVTHPPEDALDLRLGTLPGSIEIRLGQPATFACRRRGATAIVDRARCWSRRYERGASSRQRAPPACR